MHFKVGDTVYRIKTVGGRWIPKRDITITTKIIDEEHARYLKLCQDEMGLKYYKK